MDHSPAGGAFTHLLLEIFRINGELLNAGDRLTADMGLTSARWQVMGTLAERALPVPHIAREMGLTRQAVRRTVNILEKEGLAELQDNPHHKAAKLVRLTARGLRCLDQISARQTGWANDAASDIPPDDLKSARRILERLRTKIRNKDP